MKLITKRFLVAVATVMLACAAADVQARHGGSHGSWGGSAYESGGSCGSHGGWGNRRERRRAARGSHGSYGSYGSAGSYGSTGYGSMGSYGSYSSPPVEANYSYGGSAPQADYIQGQGSNTPASEIPPAPPVDQQMESEGTPPQPGNPPSPPQAPAANTEQNGGDQSP
jgi:hypothetical protein